MRTESARREELKGVDVVPLVSELEEGYSAFLETRADALIYYSLPYRDLVSSYLGCEHRYLVALRDEQVIGVFPIMLRDGPFGRVLNSLPFFGSHGSPLATDQTAQSELLSAFEREVEGAGVAAATVVENPMAPFIDAPTTHNLLDHRIGAWNDLQRQGADADSALLANAESSVGRNIRRFLSAGGVVTAAPDAVEELHRLHRLHMQAIGGSEKSRSFFQSLHLHFDAETDYQIYLAGVGGVNIGALLVFYYGSTVEYFTPAFDRSRGDDQPLAGLIISAMRDARARGYRWWNWGGSWASQAGVQRFKKKWGATEVPYRYFSWLSNPEMPNQSLDDLLAEYPGFYLFPFSAFEEP